VNLTILYTLKYIGYAILVVLGWVALLVLAYTLFRVCTVAYYDGKFWALFKTSPVNWMKQTKKEGEETNGKEG